MPRQILRFFLDRSDQANIDAASILIQDVPHDAADGTYGLETEGSIVAGTVNSSAPVPQIRPMFPGKMFFLADGSSGTNPADAAQATESNYVNWNVTGTVLIESDPKTNKEIQNLASATLVDHPNRIWYSGIEIPSAFLFETLRNELRKTAVVAASSSIGTSSSDWYKHAIAGFLAGTYGATIRIGAAEADDDAVLHQMPEVVLDSSQAFSVEIAVAFARRPQDEPDEKFDEMETDRKQVSHPRNGRIPARLALRDLQSEMVDADSGNAVADALLAPWPDGPRYTPVRCTRTWNTDHSNCSIHFPSQTISITSLDSTSPEVIYEGRLPAHGTVYFKEEPPVSGTPPDIPVIGVAMQGDMYWGDGTQPNSWKNPGRIMDPGDEFDYIGFAPNTGTAAHLVGRLPMSLEMMIEGHHSPDYTPRGLRCTYLSLRRTVRAYINNRIAGGRLNHGVKSTSSATRSIIDAAVVNVGWSVSNFAPDPSSHPDTGNSSLRNILEKLFPDPAPTHTVQGIAPPASVASTPTVGRVAYNLWQTITLDTDGTTSVEIQGATSRFFYPDEFVGRGGAGAAAYLELADLHLDPSWATASAAGTSSDDFLNGIADSMIDGTMVPGAVLQFWDNESRHTSILTRSDDNNGAGHSPVFREFIESAGTITGIRVIDQGGSRDCDIVTVGTRRILQWDGFEPDIWISANWSGD